MLEPRSLDILAANEAAASLYGVASPDRLLDRPLPALSLDDARASLERALPTGRWSDAIACLSESGVALEIQLSAHRLACGHWLGLVQDVALQRRPERMYTALFEQSPLPKFLYDLETLRYLAVNEAALRTYGYTRDEFLKLTVTDLRPPEEVASFLNALANAQRDPRAAANQRSMGTWTHRKKSGERFEVEIMGSGFEFEGRPVRLAVAQDVTNRVRATEALREQAQAASLTADIGLCLTRGGALPSLLKSCATALVRHLDAAFARIWLLDASRNELVLEASEGLYTHLDGAHARVAVGELKIGRIAATRMPAFSNDVAHDPAVGDHAWAEREGLVSFVGYPLIVDDELVGVMALFARRPLPDATIGTLSIVADALALSIRRVIVERSKSQLEAQLRQAQKMEAVGRLAGGIAHDFNNMLTIILSYAELIEDDPDAPTSVLSDLAQVTSAAQRATELTRQLLAFSRQQALQPRRVDMNVTVGNLERMLRRVIGEDIALEAKLAVGLPPVMVDQGQLEQAIMNLAVNARDAMPDGGCLRIETKAVALDERLAAELGLRPGPHVALTVADNGLGMDEETRSRIFEPFFTTKAVGKGTGLGLATVFGIVQQSLGAVQVESRPGQGARFTLYFPEAGGDELVASASRPPSRVPRREGRACTIMLVEDDQQLRALAEAVLLRRGFHVIAGCDGVDALARAATHPGDIDLLVTDLVMPRMNGRELDDRLQHERPELRVLYMSGYTDDVMARFDVEATAVAFLPKPFTPNTLLEAVDRVLDAPLEPAPRDPLAG